MEALEGDLAVAFQEAIAKIAPDVEVDEAILEYVGGIAAELVHTKNDDIDEWIESAGAMLGEILEDEEHVRVVCEEVADKFGCTKVEVVENTTSSKDIYIENLTMAYMGKLLLKETTMDLKHGHCYGLIGQNGVGKTTLLRRMALGDIANYPLDRRTVYVQSDIVAAMEGLTVRDFVPKAQRETLTHEKIKLENLLQKEESDHRAVRMRLNQVLEELAEIETPEGLERAEQVLDELLFTPEMKGSSIKSLSGGWRMRLALAHAVFYRTDILLLDEPTNHLAIDAVAWLVNYVQSLAGETTVIIVSHNRQFLEDVVSDIMHLNDLRFTYYEGGIANFEVKVLESGDAQNQKFVMSWHEKVKNRAASAEDEVMTFVFPKPGRLYGVSRLSQPVIRLENINFTYPNTERQILFDVTCRLTMNSRVSLVGGNGAGKSTLMKLLVGEMQPNHNGGEVWKHPNLRISFVAQHSGAHLVKYLDKTPVYYLLERFRGGQDHEIDDKDTIKLTFEETIDQQQMGKVEDIRDRRFLGQRIEYLIKWVGKIEDKNTWVKEADLNRMEGEAVKKMMRKFNECRAADNAELRQLTRAEVRKHLADFGIDGDIAEGNIERMSGGQKSRLTLAAAMWMCPHVLVLDEPTNYLDIESLFALQKATEKFSGGIIVVSHDRDFSAAFCKTLWVLQNGRMTVYQEKEFSAALDRYVAGEF